MEVFDHLLDELFMFDDELVNINYPITPLDHEFYLCDYILK